MSTQTDDDGTGSIDPTYPDPEAIAIAIGDMESQRKWINCIKGLTESRYMKPFTNPNVQIAYDDMLLAAFERLERILNCDRSYYRRNENARPD